MHIGDLNWPLLEQDPTDSRSSAWFDLGVVRQERLLALTPSEATTLSRHELHDALARLTVEHTIEPALTIEAATPLAETARLLLEQSAHEALVTEAGRLVGILTHEDLLRALILREPEAVA